MGDELRVTLAEKEFVILAGGCFWCLGAVYDQVEGVESVESGYIGGNLDHHTYEVVCSEQASHAEAVRITFDSRVITYKELLEIFFAVHDPTIPNRQGNDKGTQYRSAIFFCGATQLHTAEILSKP